MRFLVAGSALGLLFLLSSCAKTACTFNSQCGPHHYCAMSRCYQECVLDTDCPRGSGCTSIGMCEVGFDGGAADAGTDAGAPADMHVPPTDMHVPPTDMPIPPVDMPVSIDLGPPPPDLGPPPADLGTPKGYLADCTFDGECMSGHCIAEGPGTSHVCSKSCTADTDCADWHFCLRAAPTGAGTCAYDDTGRSCTGATSGGGCAFACLYSAPNPGHCTHPCTTSADCAGGYACVYSTAGDTTSLKVCAWIHETCPTDVAQCDTSVGGCGYSPGSQCTGNCATTSDCPPIFGTPYTCSTISGIPYPICAPPDASDGPTGAPCSIDSDCRSHACAIPEPGRPAICLERCRPTAGCPAGFGCTAVIVPSVGAANVCAPAGLGRAGAPCTNGSDCRSASCGSASHRCLDSCLDGFCPPGTTCVPDGLTVDGFMLSSCR